MTTTAILAATSILKLSLRYRLTDDLILRSSWSTGFRAPSLSQLGAGTSLTANYIDCGADQPFNALCGDFGGTAGELEFDQETLGNKNLDAESSEAINIGASWNLTEDLQFTIDYLEIQSRRYSRCGCEYHLRCLCRRHSTSGQRRS